MRSREGPLLALGCFVGTLAILAIVLAVASDSAAVSGAATIILGALIALAARPLAEVFAHWSWPPVPWPVWVALGMLIAVAGVVRITSA